MHKLKSIKRKFVATLVFSLLASIAAIIHGVFLDVDYYGTEFSPNIKQKSVKEFIETGLNKADEVKKALHSLILPPEN